MQILCKTAAYVGIDWCQSFKDSQEIEAKFVEHVAMHGLQFGTKEEYEFRLGIFAERDAEFQEINANQTSFRVGHNKFSTWTEYEKKRLRGQKPSGDSLKEPVILEETDLETLDWRTKGVVSPVQDQGQCGSCWAFSSVCSMESSYAVQNQKLYKLSEQQLLECDWGDKNCMGGDPTRAFQYFEESDSMLEKDYPYLGKIGNPCSYDKSKGHVRVQDFAVVKPDSVAQLKAAIAKQPVSVVVDAHNTVFWYYESGVLDSDLCGTNLDHAINAVGFGTENGKDYYLIRNSWGTKYGDKGYLKIAMVDGYGICGVQMSPSYPIAGDPK